MIRQIGGRSIVVVDDLPEIDYSLEINSLDVTQGEHQMDMPRRLGAEFFGTFWLTFAGCGSAVLAAGFPALGIGFLA